MQASSGSLHASDTVLASPTFTKSTIFLLFLFFGRIFASQAAPAAPVSSTTFPSHTPTVPQLHVAEDADHSLKQPPPPLFQQDAQLNNHIPTNNDDDDEKDKSANVIIQHPQDKDNAQAHLGGNSQDTTSDETRNNVDKEQQPPAYTPAVSPRPDDEAALLSKGLRQTTYYECRTAASGREHCGWHVPIVQAAATARKTTETSVVVAVVFCIAGAFVAGMM
jgi:hypothetical protein